MHDTRPPAEQWPVLQPPHCPTCQCSNTVVFRGPATLLTTGTEVNVWSCQDHDDEFTVPITRWPVLDGPDCPTCQTPVTCWAALEPDQRGDLWICEDGHEFVLTPEGVILLPSEGDAA